MEFKKFDASLVKDVVKLWNENVVPYEIYAEFTEESFTEKFLKNPNYDENGSVVCVENDEVIAFGNACFYKQNKGKEGAPGFINMLVVKKEYQRQGIGSKILGMLEDFLKDNGIMLVRNYFGSPINLKWYIPGYDKHEHAGAPAVPFNSPYYLLLLANGYNVNGQHDGFHIDLTKFEMKQPVLDKIAENEKDGYTITYYDEKIHYGFDEMFDALNHDGFRAAVKTAIKNGEGSKLLICQKDGEILGFTGPVRTEPSGRAYLSGVAIHPKAQKRGLGKTMFCELCRRSKENGAKFMTLFTGADNRARNIYLYAGLRIARSFVIMKKELK